MSETWFGWLRRDRRHRWRRVCGPCGTLAECSRQLGAEARRLGILERNTCMTTGGYPRDVQAGAEATLPLDDGSPSAPKTDGPSGRYLEGH